MQNIVILGTFRSYSRQFSPYSNRFSSKSVVFDVVPVLFRYEQ